MSVKNPTIGEWTDQVLKSANKVAAYGSDSTARSQYEHSVRRLVETCIDKRLAELNRRHDKKGRR